MHRRHSEMILLYSTILKINNVVFVAEQLVTNNLYVPNLTNIDTSQQYLITIFSVKTINDYYLFIYFK